MPTLSGQLQATATAQRLSNMYGGASLNNIVNAAQDVPFREVHLSAETATVYVSAAPDTAPGTPPTASAAAYGMPILTTATVPVKIGPFDNGGIKLSDIWVGGTGIIHVFGVRY